MGKKKLSGIDKQTEEKIRSVMVRRRKELSVRGGGTRSLGNVLKEVLANRKIGRFLQSEELSSLWNESVEKQIAEKTKVVSFRNRVLLVGVSDSVLMSELENFHKHQVQKEMNDKRPDLEIKKIKFRLNAALGKKQQ